MGVLGGSDNRNNLSLCSLVNVILSLCSLVEGNASVDGDRFQSLFVKGILLFWLLRTALAAGNNACGFKKRQKCRLAVASIHEM